MAKLFVIPGHGAGDSGACGNGYQEQERVRALATKIKQYGGDSVMLADFSRNYYADGGINRLTISKDYKIVELHMDSASASAKGGHVIIQAGIGGADEYDRKLADLMLKWFPGRSSRIVERNDLANPARAAARGYNYRLVENGFISNAGDVAIFNKNIDAIAKGYCEAFGITTERPKTWPLIMYTSNNGDNQTWVQEWDDNREWFRLKCKADGRYLDVYYGEDKVGTRVRVCEGNGSDAQLWKVEPCADYYYPITNAPVYFIPKCAPDLCLGIVDYADKDGALLELQSKENRYAQEWNVIDYAHNEVRVISNRGCNRVLDVKGGGK